MQDARCQAVDLGPQSEDTAGVWLTTANRDFGNREMEMFSDTKNGKIATRLTESAFPSAQRPAATVE